MSAVAEPAASVGFPWPVAGGTYRPRRPRETLLHRVVREHFQTFLAQTHRLYARPLPRYVIQEFEKYVACGDLARGHVRVVCGRCGLERVVPFSCKTRGLCASCAGRRMADSACRLVDCVLPAVPIRQWVLSLPYDLRLLAAARADVLRDIVRIFARTIFRCLRRRLRMPGAPAGAVAACHRGGGALNLNVHLHLLLADGLFVRHPAGGAGFHRAPAPSPADLAWVVQTVRQRVLRRLARMHLLRDDRLVGEQSNETPEPTALEACETLALRGAELESRDDATTASPDDLPPGRRSSRWSAHEAGFDVHAGVRVPAGDHVGRERLARYITRPAFAMERFSELPDGRIAYRVRHPLGSDRTHRVMTPVELLARLAALVPPPRYPLLRYFGVFAAHSPWRSAVVPRPPDESAPCHHVHVDDAPPSGPPSMTPAPPAAADPLFAVPEPVPRTLSAEHWRRLDDGALLARQPRVDWATLLRRTWAEDILCCPRCHGRMAVIEPVTEPDDIRRSLAALGLPADPVSLRAGPRPRRSVDPRPAARASSRRRRRPAAWRRTSATRPGRTTAPCSPTTTPPRPAGGRRDLTSADLPHPFPAPRLAPPPSGCYRFSCAPTPDPSLGPHQNAVGTTTLRVIWVTTYGRGVWKYDWGPHLPVECR